MSKRTSKRTAQRRSLPKPGMTSREYERTVANIYDQFSSDGTRVTLNEHITGKSGRRRQIDVAIRADVIGHTILVIVECKMLGRPVGIGHVDALVGKIADVGARTGVLVSDSGFDDGALEAAAEHGVHVVSVVDASVPSLRSRIHVPMRVTFYNVSDPYQMNLSVIPTSEQAATTNRAEDGAHALEAFVKNGRRVISEFHEWSRNGGVESSTETHCLRRMTLLHEPVQVVVDFSFQRMVRSFVNDNIFADAVGIYDQIQARMIRGQIGGFTLEEEQIVKTWREVPSGSPMHKKDYTRIASYSADTVEQYFQAMLTALRGA